MGDRDPDGVSIEASANVDSISSWSSVARARRPSSAVRWQSWPHIRDLAAGATRPSAARSAEVSTV
jgi:hypothetical protein